MSQKIDQVKKGYTELSPLERQEIREFILWYEGQTINEQRLMSDHLNRSLGPKSGASCPCCGR